MNTLRTLLFTWLMTLVLFTSDIDTKIRMFHTKIPYYNRPTLPLPTKPADFCMPGLCPKTQHHIACHMPFWGPKCQKPYSGIDMDVNQHIILTIHNEIRDSLKTPNTSLPTAKLMNRLIWDKDLYVVAMRVVNYCQKVDGFCFNVPNHLKVGKNDFILKTDSAIPKVAMLLKHLLGGFQNLLFEEISANDVHSFPTNATHLQRTLAQMILGSATKIGCGMLMRFERVYYIAYLTCLYDIRVEPGISIYK